MNEEKKEMTEAEIQIERLKMMKIEREKKIKDFHIDEAGAMDVNAIVGKKAKRNLSKQGANTRNTVKISKANIDYASKMAKLIKSQVPGIKISKGKIINLILKQVFIDFSPGEIKTKEDLDALIKKIKNEAV